MILVIDVGNTNITLGTFDGDKLICQSRLATDRNRTSDQYAVELLDIIRLNGLSLKDYENSVLSSVVPEVTDVLSSAVRKVIGKLPMVLTGKTKTGLEISIDTPSELGSDLVAVAVGAKCKYKMPCLVIDMGTATKIIVLDENGAFRGCTISPGMGISLNALAGSASLLPRISFSAPEKTIGTDTVECMQSGLVYGTVGMLDGLVERICLELGYHNPSIVATGGYSKYIVGHLKHLPSYDKNLVLEGLKAIYEMNK